MALNSDLHSLLQETPKLILGQVIEEKLHDCGIDNDEPLMTAIVEHILSGSTEKFQWNDEIYRDVTFSFTDGDVDEVVRRVHIFFDEGLPSVVQATVRESAKDTVKALTDDWPEQKIYEQYEIQAFRARLDLRWSKGLDPLRMLLMCSREISERYANALARSKAKKGIVRRNVLILLHMRACQTTMEIITLLENGLADGALARWRTLYEVGVIATLIDMHGDDIAQRYLDHDAVAMKRSMDNELKFYSSTSGFSFSKRRQMEISREFQSVMTQYGKEFKSNYGWASHHLGIKNPTFQNLEASAEQESLPPEYKWASFKIHAGVTGLLRNLGNMTEQFTTLSGASNAGLQEPAIYTAYTLTRISALLIGNSRKLENIVQLATLCELRDKVAIECARAACKLEKDEKECSDELLK